MTKLLHLKLFLYVCTALICGCNASSLNLLENSKKQKQINVKFSAGIFLNHKMSGQNQRIFVQIRNLSCPQFIEKMERTIYTTLKQQRFNIVDDPIKAGLLLQANIIQCDISKAEMAQLALDKGYGIAISKDKVTNNNAAIENDSIYSIIADLQISERVMEFNVKPKAALATVKPWKQYQTRLAITKKPIRGKDFNASVDWLIEGMAVSIAKIFTNKNE